MPGKAAGPGGSLPWNSSHLHNLAALATKRGSLNANYLLGMAPGPYNCQDMPGI